MRLLKLPIGMNLSIFLLVLALFYSGWKFSAWAPLWIDLPMGDEADYLHSGVQIAEGAGFYQEVDALLGDWSPLYSLWYYVLYQFSGDKVNLFYLNYRLTGILLVVFFYLIVVRLGFHPFWAAFFAFMVLISRLPWVGIQRVTTFSLMSILGLLWIVLLSPSPLRLWVGIWALWIGAFARPEYLLASGIIGVFFLWTHRKRKSLHLLKAFSLSWWIWVLVPPIVAFSFTGLWGIPASQERSIYAFGQHYALTDRFCLRRERGATWEEVYRNVFGSADSWIEILRQQPQEVFLHLRCNVTSMVRDPRYLAIAFYHAPLFLVKSPQKDLAGKRESILFLFFAIAGVIYRLYHWKTLKGRFESLFHAAFLPLWLALFISVLPIVVIIYNDKDHYRIMPLTFLMLLLACLLLPRKQIHPVSLSTLSGMILLLVAIAPPFSFLFPSPVQLPELHNKATVYTVQSLISQGNHPLRISLTKKIHYDLFNYLSRSWVELPYAPEDGFLDFVLQTQPDLIVIDLRYFQGDEGWEAFFQNPAPYGYWMHSITQYRLLFGRQGIVSMP